MYCLLSCVFHCCCCNKGISWEWYFLSHPRALMEKLNNALRTADWLVAGRGPPLREQPLHVRLRRPGILPGGAERPAGRFRRVHLYRQEPGGGRLLQGRGHRPRRCGTSLINPELLQSWTQHHWHTDTAINAPLALWTHHQRYERTTTSMNPPLLLWTHLDHHECNTNIILRSWTHLHCQNYSYECNTIAMNATLGTVASLSAI